MNNIYKFTGKAETYAKYRPSYPQAYLDYLFKSVPLNRESVIAEIGSGTGILLKQLLERHPCVIGVEPNNDMDSSPMSGRRRTRCWKTEA